MQPPWGISAASTIETVILTFILGEYARDPKAHYTIKTGSPMTEFDRSDREEWNRRGYVRGAWHLYRALSDTFTFRLGSWRRSTLPAFTRRARAATVEMNAPRSRIEYISRAVRHSLSTAAKALSSMVGGFFIPLPRGMN
jgi:hypothetical protein